MKNKENALLVIDPQNDFCDPKGSLSVAGAVEDMQRLSRFILNNLKMIGKVMITLDSHRVIDISHPSGWVDAQGNPISMKGFLAITHQDTLDGKYTWLPNPRWAIEYTGKLEASGQFTHYIWPEHCIISTWGHNMFPALADAVHAWERQYGGLAGTEYVTKGSNPMSEHFGAFQAQVPIDNEPGTQPRISLLNTLQQYSRLFVAGEAKSHCIVSSVRQILDLAPELASKMVILTDCMSDVTNFEGQGQDVYDRARSMGVQFAKSTDPIGQAAAAVI